MCRERDLNSLEKSVGISPFCTLNEVSHSSSQSKGRAIAVPLLWGNEIKINREEVAVGRDSCGWNVRRDETGNGELSVLLEKGGEGGRGEG